MALVDEKIGGANNDPESLLNEWLGELTVLSAGLNASMKTETALQPLEIVAPRIDTYRFSMATLEDTQDADLDAILGELCVLDAIDDEKRSQATCVSGLSTSIRIADESNKSYSKNCAKENSMSISSAARSDSPDNDSAFSDNVSMLSNESSISSNASCRYKSEVQPNIRENDKDERFKQKADKIKIALERMREANIKKLFIKAFSIDGSSKSLLVDEKMTCGFVTRLLADKNHVTMDPKWAIIEHLPDLYMERVYEDHEILVDNLMLWTRDSKNKILFVERPDKISLFRTPEKFLLSEDDKGWSSEHDEHSRQLILEEFFERSGDSRNMAAISGHPVPPVEGPLYLKNDSKKGWKKYYFVLRPSGLYYSHKDKVKNLKDLICLATLDSNEVYVGMNWKKKYKSPTDFCFAIKHPRLQQPKSFKFIKFLCADDQYTLERWVTAMRIAKHGKQILENYKTLLEELAQEDLDHLAHARSCSISSIPQRAGGAATGGGDSPAPSSASTVISDTSSSGRHSRASSSSSSGCLSDGGTASENAFDCEFPMGTIKRKPSMKANIPLTWMTRQLKEAAEMSSLSECAVEEGGAGGTLTRRPYLRDTHSRAEPGDDPDATLKRSHPIDTTVGFCYNNVDTSLPDECGQYDDKLRNSIIGGSSVYPPKSSEHLAMVDPSFSSQSSNEYTCPMLSSTTSLESLPPPPLPLEEPLNELSASLLSLPPPPAELEAEPRATLALLQLDHAANARRPCADCRPHRTLVDTPSYNSSYHSDNSIYGSANYGACVTEFQNKKLNQDETLINKTLNENSRECRVPTKKVNFVEGLPNNLDKKNKKITFNAKDPPPLPRKPLPPKRSETTRLSSPKKLIDSNSNPPKEFLKDLQKVIRKKWQIAQKCKLEPEITPHEVLGFREYPLSEDYKETIVSMWVKEHYGSRVESPFYENVLSREEPQLRREEPVPMRKRAPPAPPRRSESTHLTTQPHS